MGPCVRRDDQEECVVRWRARRSVRGSSNSLSPKSMMAIPTNHIMLLVAQSVSQTLQCKDSRRTGIVFGIIVNAAISFMESGSVASSIEKFRESIDNTRRISTAAR